MPEVIWMRARDARRGPRPSHTLDDIATAAVAVADADGLASVTIRSVAAHLGSGAASLYRYIESKDDLFDLMVDAISAEYDFPEAPSGRWREDVRLVAEEGRRINARHPWAATLSANASWGPHVQRYMEFFLASLSPTGLDTAERLEVIAMITSWVANFASFEGQQSSQARHPEALAARLLLLRSIAATEDQPHLAAAASAILRTDPADTDPDRLFSRGLDRLLRSIAP